MPRVYVMVLDSYGLSSSADGSKFGDAGLNTFDHIARARILLADAPGVNLMRYYLQGCDECLVRRDAHLSD